MVINTLYSKYFQKSKIFLYPLLGIKRGTSVVPSETYLGWNNIYTPEDMKLICLYEMRQDQDYKRFEANVLLKHTRLHDYKVINSEQTVFVFDFSDLKEDWDHLINGRYSKLSKQTKETILGFFEQYSGNYVYINSYLNPENWFERYSEILGVDKKLIEEVGELCDKPDLDKECLLIVVANLENINILD
jgi:hypothetical protein